MGVACDSLAWCCSKWALEMLWCFSTGSTVVACRSVDSSKYYSFERSLELLFYEVPLDVVWSWRHCKEVYRSRVKDSETNSFRSLFNRLAVLSSRVALVILDFQLQFGMEVWKILFSCFRLLTGNKQNELNWGGNDHGCLVNCGCTVNHACAIVICFDCDFLEFKRSSERATPLIRWGPTPGYVGDVSLRIIVVEIRLH